MDRRRVAATVAVGPLAVGLFALVLGAHLSNNEGPTWWSVVAYIFAMLATYTMHRVMGDPLAQHDYARGYLDGHRDARRFREIIDDEASRD